MYLFLQKRGQKISPYLFPAYSRPFGTIPIIHSAVDTTNKTKKNYSNFSFLILQLLRILFVSPKKKIQKRNALAYLLIFGTCHTPPVSRNSRITFHVIIQKKTPCALFVTLEMNKRYALTYLLTFCTHRISHMTRGTHISLHVPQYIYTYLYMSPRISFILPTLLCK